MAIAAASGLHGNIFQPPRTPASASPYLSATAFAPHQELSVTRKRSRTNSIKADVPVTPGYFDHRKQSWATHDASGALSPAPLANTQYSLAGGFDTPTLAATSHYDNDDLAGERDFRSRWDSDTSSTPVHNTFAVHGPLSRERNGRARVSSGYHQNQSAEHGWGKFVLGIVGGVAGTVWNFCRESAFRGFYAGGGEGFSFAKPTNLQPNFDAYYRSTTPLPGRFPHEDEFMGDFEQDNTPPRPSKRIHTDTGAGWVMVNHDLDTRDASPRLSVRKVSSNGIPRLSSPTRSSASRASSRRSLVPISRRTSSHTTHAGAPMSLDAFTPAFSSHERRASTASTRSPVQHHRRGSTIRPSTPNGTPLSPDAQRFISRRDKQDRDADKSMRKMSRQVQDLIRQGQAALGTKFEVEDDTDEGFEEGDDVDGWEDAAASGMTAIARW
ncbi:hypothetical protein MBLNU459_g2477t1 [Dothideomycetes sp. NU459]